MIGGSVMKRFWRVDFWPKEWPSDDPRLTQKNRLSKCGTVISKAYSEALRTGAPVPARSTWGRFVLNSKLNAFQPGDVIFDDGEVHSIPGLPLELLDAPDMVRRAAFLDLLHDSCLMLAQARSWPSEPFISAREKVIDEGLRFHRISPSKVNRSRKLEAHLDFEIDGWGDAWTKVVVVERARDVEIHSSPPLYSHASVKAWNAIRRTLRWTGSTEISFDHWPGEEPFGPKEHLYVHKCNSD